MTTSIHVTTMDGTLLIVDEILDEPDTATTAFYRDGTLIARTATANIKTTKAVTYGRETA